jgi:hypothetical protein
MIGAILGSPGQRVRCLRRSQARVRINAMEK